MINEYNERSSFYVKYPNTMTKKVIAAGLLVATLAIVVGAGTALAAPATPTTARPTGITTATGFVSLVANITNWIFAFFLLFAIIFIVLAGFQFVTAGGDPAAVSQARTKLLWAAVGIGVALLSRGIPNVVGDIVGT